MTTIRKIFLGSLLTTILIATMGLFSFFKESQKEMLNQIEPYKDNSTNLIYNLLFCDNLELFKEKTNEPHNYPFDILFSNNSSISDLQKIIDTISDPRIKVLAYNRQIASGHKPTKKELIAVIVEVGLDEGLDVLASFNDGTARYINHTGKILVWETTEDKRANEITKQLFESSVNIVNKIGAWDKPRRPNPTKGNVRITFLVSDGLYFGEGTMDVLFRDPMASPALTTATELMQYLTEKSLEKKN